MTTDERHLDEDRLIDLASGLLSAEDLAAALGHVKSCAACEGRFRQLVADREGVKASPRPTGAREGTGAGIAAGHQRRRRIVAAIAAAAAIVAALIVLPRWIERDTESLQVWLPTDRARALFRLPSSDDGGTGLDAALAAYESRDASRALTLLRSAEVPADLEEIRQLYLASALVLNGRPAEAEALLTRLDLSTMPQPDRRWARLTLYVALRQLERDQEADGLIEELVAEPGEVGEMARAELEQRRR